MPKEQTQILSGYGFKEFDTYITSWSPQKTKKTDEDPIALGMEISTGYNCNIIKFVTDHYILSYREYQGEHKE